MKKTEDIMDYKTFWRPSCLPVYCILVLTINSCFSQSNKPKPEEWINVIGKERLPEQKLNFISWLVDGCYFYNLNGSTSPRMRIPKCSNETGSFNPSTEFQSFDGFYNNIFKTDLGAVDTPILRRVPPVYDDGVYAPATKNRINPFDASQLMNRTPQCGPATNRTACGSKTGKSAFLVYFGQQVVEEILDAQRPGCPPEYFNVEIPKDHEFHMKHPKKNVMPLLRSRYSQSTGHAPGSPRQQLNEITPWIDGGLIYGTSKGWADVLRTRPESGTLAEHGKLATDETGLFPARNTLRMPLANPPPPAFHSKWTDQHETAKVNRFFVLGNPRGNENAFLLAFGVVLFRWHNQFATYFHHSRPEWSGERIFQESRKWAIATYQQIVMYDWLPEWVGEPIEPYKGYNPSVDPQIEQFFQTAAMRFGHTLVTPGAYMRDYACAGCAPIGFYGLGGDHRSTKQFDFTQTVRTCNIFWRPQEPLEMEYKGNFTEMCRENDNRTVTDIDRLLMGLSSQLAEREDHMIVEDLRGRVFGPLEFSRRDLMAVNIQRGRDHGTPDYNTAREAFGLKRISSVDEYMRETGTHTPREIVESLQNIHNSTENPWNNIDVWTGGILETSERPGPLFRAIIKDQFSRIRDADRFWFENTKWSVPRFSAVQIQRIKELKVYDMIMSVTRMLPEDLQPNPFQVPTQTNDVAKCTPKSRSGVSSSIWQTSSCTQYNVDNRGRNVPFDCYHFPQLDSKFVPVEQCTKPGSYDYFTGSEASFIATYVVLGIFIIGVVGVLYFLSNYMRKTTMNILEKSHDNQYTLARDNELLIEAREWQKPNDGARAVALEMHGNKLAVRCHRGELLRDIDFKKIADVDNNGIKRLNIYTFKKGYVIIENSKEYDLILQFDSPYIKQSFLGNIKKKLENVLEVNIEEAVWKKHLSKIVTKEMRIKKLEKFFREVFHLQPTIDKDKLHENVSDKDIVNIELSLAEFADSLGMSPKSDFVQKIFSIIDQDNNGYISFKEFFCMLAVFKDGSPEDKVEFLFQMYDVSGTGKVSLSEFKAMLGSMISAATSEIHEDTINASIEDMIRDINFTEPGFVTLREFQAMMQSHNETIRNVQLNFSGVTSAPTASNVPSKRASRHEKLVHAMTELNSGYNNTSRSVGDPMENITVQKKVVQNKVQHWFDMNRLQIFWVTLYTLVVLAIFAERSYYYSVEREHGGLRHIAGYGVTVTRGAASVMMFCYATLLLTMCRNLITKLRDTFLQRWIPFDYFVDMHKYIACIGLLFSVIHVIGHAINFYSISTQTSEDLTCLFRDYHRPTHVLPKFHYWTYQTITGLTGILLVMHAAIIYIFATTFARKFTFRVFWITHQSYPLWYILIILHGSGRLVQEPLFLNFLLGPLFLFVLDKIVTVARENIEIPVIDAQLLPSNVTKLTIYRPANFDFKSGQWIRLACLALNPNEFHPFTISSAPHEEHLTVHIRAVGPFTANIRQAYENKVLPKVHLDGPYGEAHEDWYRFEVAVLIGGGIGVTPFASILKDVAANPNLRNCKKIYFLWVTRTQKHFEWMVDILRHVENSEIIAVHVFITQLHDNFDLRTVLLYICEQNFQRVSNRSLFTGLKAITNFGRPDFKKFFENLLNKHPDVNKFGVFSCGPLPMCKSVADACVEVNQKAENEKIFQHYYENF